MEENKHSFSFLKRLFEAFAPLFELSDLTEYQGGDYTVSHYFLYLRHANIIPKDAYFPKYNNASEIIQLYYNETARDKDQLSEELFNEFRRDCEKIDSVTFQKIWQNLSQITDDDFNWYYSSMFDYFLSYMDMGLRDRIRYVDQIQPTEVSSFIAKICPLTDDMSVYNPFAGLASYCIEMMNPKYYIGQEVASRTWALGIIRLDAYNYKAPHFEIADSLKSWKTGTQKNSDKIEPFDLIVSTPPFGLIAHFQDSVDNKSSNKDSFEEDFIRHGINSLSTNGRLISVFHIGILFHKKYNSIREKIVDEDLLEAVITLPSNLEKLSSVTTVILCLNMNKRNKGVIKMIDATSCYREAGSINCFQYDDALKFYNNNKDGESIKHVPNSIIASNDYNLIPNRYFEENISLEDGYKLIRLSDVLSLYKSPTHNNKFGKCISYRNLASSPINYLLDLDILENKEINRSHYKLESEVLLLGNSFSSIKPTLCNAAKSNPIYCPSSITPFVVNNDLIETPYLIIELNSDYVKRQIKSFSTGIIIPKTSIKDLLGIRIKLPSIEIQKAIVEGTRYAILFARSKEISQEYKINAMKRDFVEELRIKKHALSQHQNNIRSSILALSKYVEKKGLGSYLISERRGIALEDHIKNLVDATEEMGTMLTLLTEVDIFGKPQVIDLEDFLRNFLLKFNHRSFAVEYYHDWGSFVDLDDGCFDTINKNGDKALKNKGTDYTLKNGVKVFINKRDLTELFENIFNNAITHGFTDANRKDYKITVRTTYNLDKGLTISVSNNGNPLPEGMDTNRFSIKGEKAGKTGHEGIGGYRIKSIVEHYRGSFTIENIENPLSIVECNVYLPIYKPDEEI